MECQFCGASLPKSATFCFVCGKRFDVRVQVDEKPIETVEEQDTPTRDLVEVTTVEETSDISGDMPPKPSVEKTKKVPWLVFSALIVVVIGLLFFVMSGMRNNQLLSEDNEVDINEMHVVFQTNGYGLGAYVPEDNHLNELDYNSEYVYQVNYVDSETFFYIKDNDLMLYESGTSSLFYEDVNHFFIDQNSKQMVVYSSYEGLFKLVGRKLISIDEEATSFQGGGFLSNGDYVYLKVQDNQQKVVCYNGQKTRALYTELEEGVTFILSVTESYVYLGRYETRGSYSISTLTYDGRHETIAIGIYSPRFFSADGIEYYNKFNELCFLEFESQNVVVFTEAIEDDFPYDYNLMGYKQYNRLYETNNAYKYYNTYMDRPYALSLKTEYTRMISNSNNKLIAIIDQETGDTNLFRIDKDSIETYEIPVEVSNVFISDNREGPRIVLVDKKGLGHIYNYVTGEIEPLALDVTDAHIISSSGHVLYKDVHNNLFYEDGSTSTLLADKVDTFTSFNNDTNYMMTDENDYFYIGEMGQEPVMVLQQMKHFAFFGSSYIYLTDKSNQLYVYNIEGKILEDLEVKVNENLTPIVFIPREHIDNDLLIYSSEGLLK